MLVNIQDPLCLITPTVQCIGKQILNKSYKGLAECH